MQVLCYEMQFKLKATIAREHVASVTKMDRSKHPKNCF